MERFILSDYARAKLERESAAYRASLKRERAGNIAMAVFGVFFALAMAAPFIALALKG